MKVQVFNLFLSISILIFITSCDDIKENQKYDYIVESLTGKWVANHNSEIYLHIFRDKIVEEHSDNKSSYRYAIVDSISFIGRTVIANSKEEPLFVYFNDDLDQPYFVYSILGYKQELVFMDVFNGQTLVYKRVI